MRTFLLSIFLFLSIFCFSQEEVFLQNPSFEDFPKLSQTPSLWFNCGFPGQSQIDIHPVPENQFQVNQIAIDGEAYIGMITRENETWEAIGQRLSQTLTEGKTYRFSIYLARSANYLSGFAHSSKEKVNFNEPIKLRIWGGNGYCKKEELLAESPLITNTEWQNFDFTLRPQSSLNYITFEAFYQIPTPAPYNGNILLDNASSIFEVKNAEFLYKDSLRVVYLDSLGNNPPVFYVDESQEEKNLNEKAKNQATPKLGSNIPTKKFKEGVLNEADRTFLREQLKFVKFEDKSRYLEDKGIDAIIEIVKKLNAFEEDLKISFSMYAVDKSWDKGRGKEVLNLFLEAGIPRTNIRLVKSTPNIEKVYFEGGDYSDIYLAIY